MVDHTYGWSKGPPKSVKQPPQRVGEQLRTVEYLVESGKSCRKKAEQDRSRTPVLRGATM